MAKNKLQPIKQKLPQKPAKFFASNQQKWLHKQLAKATPQKKVADINYDFYSQYSWLYENLSKVYFVNSTVLKKNNQIIEGYAGFLLFSTFMLLLQGSNAVYVNSKQATDICNANDYASNLFQPTCYFNDQLAASSHNFFKNHNSDKHEFFETHVEITEVFIKNLFLDMKLSPRNLLAQQKIIDAILQVRKKSSSTQKYIDRVLTSRDFSINILPRSELSQKVENKLQGATFAGAYTHKTHQITLQQEIVDYESNNQKLSGLIQHEFWHANMGLVNACLPSGRQDVAHPFNNTEEYEKFIKATQADVRRVEVFKSWLMHERFKTSLTDEDKKILNEKEFKKIKATLSDYHPRKVTFYATKIEYDTLPVKHIGGILTNKNGVPAKILNIEEKKDGTVMVQVQNTDKLMSFADDFFETTERIQAIYGFTYKIDTINWLTEYDAELTANFDEKVKKQILINRYKYHYEREARAFASQRECKDTSSSDAIPVTHIRNF